MCPENRDRRTSVTQWSPNTEHQCAAEQSGRCTLGWPLGAAVAPALVALVRRWWRYHVPRNLTPIKWVSHSANSFLWRPIILQIDR
eukprot:SAG25_NODE_2491_length_1572_cov_5.468432_1_plen_86_part_00